MHNYKFTEAIHGMMLFRTTPALWCAIYITHMNANYCILAFCLIMVQEDLVIVTRVL